jgi:hypothetical protein
MSRLDRAEAVLAAAFSRRPGSVVPGGAQSPMDSMTTQSVDFDLVAECDLEAKRQRQLDELAAGPRPAERRSRTA